jgi:hypothetical protein
MNTSNTPDDDAPGAPGQLRDKLPPIPVPPGLEARIAGSLRAAGLIEGAPPRRRWSGALWATAAGLVIFLTGYGVAVYRNGRPPDAAAQTRYALLLYAGADVADTAGTPGDVEEHRRWAATLANGGHTIVGEKLARDGVVLNPSGLIADAGPALEGFFIVSAANETEAQSIARSSPHFKHGGRVVIRRIEPT